MFKNKNHSPPREIKLSFLTEASYEASIHTSKPETF